ncbi:MAG: hypothetical protein ACOY0T_10025 [Myxococcota bacterium]
MSQTPAGFTWGDYLADLIDREGSLTAVAEKLAQVRSFAEDVASIEKALRRLRTRELRPGGKWGARLLSLFGLPSSVDARLRWMARYHSRFTDLPLPVCEDLVRLWDHPPTSERRESRIWLAIARASIALRREQAELAASYLAQCDVHSEAVPLEARCEALLASAFIASKSEPKRAAALLEQVSELLPNVADVEERACFEARLVDQRAYELNRGRNGAPPDPVAAEVLYRTLPSSGVPPFAACRRANGLAYALWKQGRAEEGAAFAREAARHAGDGGHARLRVMALAMLARIDPREAAAHERALAISERLDDETLRLRLARARSRSGT